MQPPAPATRSARTGSPGERASHYDIANHRPVQVSSHSASDAKITPKALASLGRWMLEVGSCAEGVPPTSPCLAPATVLVTRIFARYRPITSSISLTSLTLNHFASALEHSAPNVLKGETFRSLENPTVISSFVAR